MNFIQPNFFIFLIIFLAIYAFAGGRARIWLGIVGSFYFYAYFSATYALLLLGSSVLDFLVGAKLGRMPKGESRQKWLWLSVGTNLGLLCVFKYDDFIFDNVKALLPSLLDFEKEKSMPPMGISFFTFQTMSYTIDIYRGRLKPVESFRHFLLYISFFPQLVAGPIVRARTFLPQIKDACFKRENLRPGLLRFARGFAKKACFADSIGVMLVDPLFNDVTSATPMTAWLGLLAYGLQLYLDFSGYSDMAIGLGRVLGYRFPENFKYPYLANSLSDLWRRWHISLSSWIRDYVYAPLRGDNKGMWKACYALLGSMTLSGLWHGAGWNFVLFGFLHGLFLSFEKIWDATGAKSLFTCSFLAVFLHKVGLLKLMCWFWGVGLFFYSLVIFRGHSLSDSIQIYMLMSALSWHDIQSWSSSLSTFNGKELIVLLFLCSGSHIWEGLSLQDKYERYLPYPMKCVAVSSLIFLCLHFFPSGKVSPFIYFQF